MLRKKVISICCVCLVLFLLGGCSNQNELPTDVEDVGGVITKDEDLLDTTDAEFTGKLPYEDGSGLGLNEFCLTDLDIDYADVDTVKGWISEYISGEYTAVNTDDEAGVTRQRANASFGGTVEIVSYEGYYYMVELYLDPKESTDTLKSNINNFLVSYIGRRLTTIETEELSSAVNVALQGGEMAYIPSLSNTASVYFMIQDERLVVQVR